MLDLNTLQALQQAQAISRAEDAIHRSVNAADKDLGIVALPKDFDVHDLERHMPNRRRQRAAVSTSSLDGFQSYVEAQHQDGAMVFVNPLKMEATAVLNAGTPEAPGHADHVCVFQPQKTAAWAALCGIVGQRLNQRTLAEFLEDWAPYITGTWTQFGGTPIELPKAIAAVRKVTIESIRKAETEQNQLSQSASTFESVSAQSTLPLPGWTVFTCSPYPDMQPRNFELRLSIITSEKEPMLTLRLAKAEQHTEEMGRELMTLCTEATQGCSVLCVLGQYSKGN